MFSMSTNRDNLIESARRAGEWITTRQKQDGSFFSATAGIGGYYKVPYALAISGFFPEAMRLANWVRAHHFTPEGDFRAPERKATIDVHEDWPTYGNSWLIRGAHRLGQFDLSLQGAEFLLRHQASCGGFFAFELGEPYVECVGSSWSGLAELEVGNLQAAGRAAKCLCRLVAHQPDPDRFYFRMSPEGKLITEVPPGEALFYCVEASQEKQIYYQPGIALIFLCQYHLGTGDPETLTAAQAIFDFTQRCTDDVYRFPPSGKLGLGCAMLAHITDQLAPRKAAQRVADYLVDTQQTDGFWLLPEEDLYQAIKNKQGPEVVMDITAEFCTWLWEIAALL